MSLQNDAICWYVQTGEHDATFAAWNQGNFLARARRGTADLKSALIAEIRRRSPGAVTPARIGDLDTIAFARTKLEPMVSGLFPGRERALVLQTLERSVVFVTSQNIEALVAEASWLSTAWELANLYLGSVGAPPLGTEGNSIVGFSEETTCYVSSEYFAPKSRFADFVVHEAAHVFHNCKRRTVGLPETRMHDWLLDIDYPMRETFAYACEAYSRLVELGCDRRERLSLLDELAREQRPSDKRVDPEEYLSILRAAVTSRNGWKRILSRCARKPRHCRAGRYG